MGCHGVTWRLVYKDGNNTDPDGNNVNQVLGVLKGVVPTGAYKLNRVRTVFRNRGVDKLEVIAEKNLFKNVPRDLSNFATTEPAVFWMTDKFTSAIVSVDTGADSFTVSGDRREDFTEGGHIQVKNSNRGDDDRVYKVSSQSDVSYDGNADETTITVVEDVTDGTVDGDIEGWENIFRCFAEDQGTITSSGNTKLNFYGFSRYHGFENVNISSTNTVEDVASKLTPSGYTLDAPSSSNVNYIDSTGTQQTGFAPVDNYTLNDQRRRGFRELERVYGYTIKFKADKTMRFEPIGFASSIDTIDSKDEGQTNNTLGKWLEWKADDNRGNVNTIRVVNSKSQQAIIGVSTGSNTFTVKGDRTGTFTSGFQFVVDGSSGNDGTYTTSSSSYDSNADETTVSVNENVSDSTADGAIQVPLKADSGVITNSSRVNQYGKITPEEGLIKKLGWVETDKEAKRAAYQRVSKNGQNPVEGGRVSVPGNYIGNVSNSTFTLNDSTRDLDGDTFVAWEQVNFYPAQKSELHFQFEAQDELERGVEDDVAGERAQVTDSNTQDVGQQSFTGDTGSAPSDTAKTGNVDQDPSDTGVSGNVGNAGGATIIDQASLSIAGGDYGTSGEHQITTIDTDNSDTAGIYVHISLAVLPQSSISFGGETEQIQHNLNIEDQDSLNDFPPTGNGVQVETKHLAVPEKDTGDGSASNRWTYDSNSVLIFWPQNTGDISSDPELTVEYETSVDCNVSFNVTWWTIDEHMHPDSFNTDDFDHPHGDNIATDDFDHGGTGDATGQHGTSGTTDGTDVNVGQEDKTDR